MEETIKRQIIVIKGWEGFADRLQVLSHCLHYCLKNNADICIDWRDSMWGQEILDFSDYFEIVGINVVNIDNVIKRINEGASIIPSVFTIEDILCSPNPTIHFNAYTYIIDNQYNKIKEDIIIVNCKGLRTWHIDNILNNIRFKQDVANKIINRISNLKIPFTAVHLRGTDRLNNTTLLESINPAIEKYEKMHGYMKKNVYVFSDMKEMLELWKNYCPDTNILYTNYEMHKIPKEVSMSENKGTHQLDSVILDYYSVSKHEMNLDTLTDFIALCFSHWIIGNNNESVFTNMCKFISSYGKKGISKWLHGYIPDVYGINKNDIL